MACESSKNFFYDHASWILIVFVIVASFTLAIVQEVKEIKTKTVHHDTAIEALRERTLKLEKSVEHFAKKE